MQCGQQDFMPLPLPCFNSFLERKRQQEPNAFFFFLQSWAHKAEGEFHTKHDVFCCGGVPGPGCRENVGRRTGTCKSRGGGLRGLTVADASSSRRRPCRRVLLLHPVHSARTPHTGSATVPASQPLWLSSRQSRSDRQPLHGTHALPRSPTPPIASESLCLILSPPGESDRTAPLRAELSLACSQARLGGSGRPWRRCW